MKKAADAKTRIRTRQRAHAKERFRQRLGVLLNRDRIHQIEQKIARAQAVLIEARSRNRKAFFVEFEGTLIAVGYNNSTNRVVTVLPNEYIASLPPEAVAAARLLLFAEEAKVVVEAIAAGKAQRLYRSRSNVEAYMVSHMGCSVRIGYALRAKRLVLCPPDPSSSKRIP